MFPFNFTLTKASTAVSSSPAFIITLEPYTFPNLEWVSQIQLLGSTFVGIKYGLSVPFFPVFPFVSISSFLNGF